MLLVDTLLQLLHSAYASCTFSLSNITAIQPGFVLASGFQSVAWRTRQSEEHRAVDRMAVSWSESGISQAQLCI